MKKIKVLLFTLAIAGIGFTSCSDDDNNNGNDNENAIEGTYTLREVNTAAATDFDEDNTSHVNQMEESNCYQGSEIELNADQTFRFQSNIILVDETSGSSACANRTFNGIWEVTSGSGNSATITATYEGNNGQDVVLTLQKEGNELSYSTTGLFSQYPDRNDAGGAVYTTGSVEYVFRK
ncbi:MAG TPA: hypothetical protein VF581_00915 [Flavobacterium sp.]|jgi:hypothetical protein